MRYMGESSEKEGKTSIERKEQNVMVGQDKEGSRIQIFPFASQKNGVHSTVMASKPAVGDLFMGRKKGRGG